MKFQRRKNIYDLNDFIGVIYFSRIMFFLSCLSSLKPSAFSAAFPEILPLLASKGHSMRWWFEIRKNCSVTEPLQDSYSETMQYTHKTSFLMRWADEIAPEVLSVMLVEKQSMLFWSIWQPNSCAHPGYVTTDRQFYHQRNHTL